MKHMIVPAQITTVEDKITGNLTLNQLLLLTAPIFINFVLYSILPKSMHLNAYKLIVMALITFICCLASIRFKGKILLIWAITISRYNLRPHYFVFNKNETHLRENFSNAKSSKVEDSNNSIESEGNKPKPSLVITDEEEFQLSNILNNPNLSLSFMSHKKAGIRVYISEIE